MEVHHHSHTESLPAAKAGKRFKHYLFEFFMLFLAVFCGFLAESFREHQVEHQREKQYMLTMLEDLKSDTAFINYTINELNVVKNSIDSVTGAIHLPAANTDLNKVYRHIFKAFDYYSFRYNDRTISQLKSSGNFRLIRNKEVANKIIAYDRFNENEIAKIEIQRNNFYEKAIDIRNKIFDQNIIAATYKLYGNNAVPASENLVIDSLMRKNKLPVLPGSQDVLLFEFKNALLTYRTSYKDADWSYSQIIQYANELLSLIKKEYHLE